MPKPLSFQQVILRLQGFWAERGCLIWQPYSEKVGAGTMNPATVLRVLGRRPDGYHELDTEFLSLELHDSLRLSAGAGASATDFTLQIAGDRDGLGGEPAADNLVLVAARALRDALGAETVPERHPASQWWVPTTQRAGEKS